MNDLVHFSSTPLTHVRNTENPSECFKPCGLWLSVGEAWAEWCLEHQYGTDSLRYITPVTINAHANVLRLATPRELDDFTHAYGTRTLRAYQNDEINWPLVQQHYDGILIAPYQSARRLELSWYYSWDVASGCIWSASAITLGPSMCIAQQEAVA